MEQMRKIKHLRVLVFILFQNFPRFVPLFQDVFVLLDCNSL